MKKTILILLFLATYIFANELPSIIKADEIKNKEKYVFLNEDHIVFNYIKDFKNKELKKELEKGLNPNSYIRFDSDMSIYKSHRSESLLALALGYRNMEAVKLLIEYKADPNLPNSLQSRFPDKLSEKISETADKYNIAGTSISYAISQNNFEMVEYLLEKGALLNLSKIDEISCTRRDIIMNNATFSVDTKEMLEFLVSKGADISQKMANGQTILDYMTYNLELRKYIMDNYDLEKEYIICDYSFISNFKDKMNVKHFYDKIQTFSLDNELLDEIVFKNK